MRHSMLGESLSQVAGPMKDMWEKLEGPNGEIWLVRLKRMLRGENPWPELLVPASELFRAFTTVAIPATVEFSSVVFFEEDGPAWTDDCFQRLFCSQVESGAPETMLRIQTLIASAKDMEIIPALGVDKAEIALSQMWGLLKVQGQGQKGLLTIDDPNIFYVRSQLDGNVWAVCCTWIPDRNRWRVSAVSISDQRDWNRGCQVISRAA